MATGGRKDPFGASHFVIEIDGITRAGFRECTGLDSATDIILYREGDEPGTLRKVPGLTKYSNITLKWGSCDDTDLWAWRQNVVGGKMQRKNGSVVLLDDTRQETARWNFSHGWPAQWTGPNLNATATDVAVETLVIAHEGVKRA
jgi:phage tail-like protein